jgi:ubiquinone/menaquinone biosynthesis C-methylase UbiE
VEDSQNIAERYLESCREVFWKKVFQVELDYLLQHLEGSRDILSIGCGPAIIESQLSKHGFKVTGLDVSQEALNCAPDQIRTVAARAEDMPFPATSFDAVIYVASLQFIEDYRKALKRSVSVLRPNGKMIVMLLNPESVFFKEKLQNPDSYVRKIRHRNIPEIEKAMEGSFHIRAEYFMGVKQGELFESRNPHYAVLYIIRGKKVLLGAKDKKE